MKKLSILAVALLMVGSAFAASPAMNASRLFVQPNATFGFGSPATTNNNDSCDIAVTPAATVLLPYFEVDYSNSDPTTALNTVFTLTNTSAIPEIVHLTVWTDWSYPVLDFNVFLSGYDVQGISLYDLIARGNIPATGYDTSAQGRLSEDNATGNPNWADAATDADPTINCSDLPGPIPGTLLAAVQSALSAGTYTGCSGRVGGTHTNAIGYITMDVVDQCSQLLPTDAAYYDTLLYDNVIIGDYQRINPNPATSGASAGNYAGGNPLVHIRAIPEGGPIVPAMPRALTVTNLPFTFYDRYTPTTSAVTREQDRRQPLPSVWAARYLDNVSGSSDNIFGTQLIIWREGVTGATAGCAVTANSALPIANVVRFDESENPSLPTGCRVSPCPGGATFSTPETSARSVSNTTYFPGDFAGTADDGGWMYLNLSNNSAPLTATSDNGGTNGGSATALSDRVYVPYSPGGIADLTATRPATQSWVIIEMTAEGRYGVDFDAAYLGNGCSPNPLGFGSITGGVIGPLNQIPGMGDPAGNMAAFIF